MKFKLKTLTTLTALSLMSGLPITQSIVTAATWNGVPGVNDSVVNSITQYQNEANSYDGQIQTLTWSIDQNQGMIDAWTQNLKYAQDPTSNQHAIWAGREAECQRTIDNNRGPMLQRIAQRTALQQRKQQALANVEAAKAQATAEANAILDAQKPKPSQPAEVITPPSSVTPTEPSKVTPPSSISSSSSSSSSRPVETTSPKPTDESNKESTTGKPKEDTNKTEESTPIDDIVNHENEIKDELNDFNHDKKVNDFVKQNDEGKYNVSPDALKAAILEKINEYRTVYGLDTVEKSDVLVDYAVQKANDAKDQMPNGQSGHWNSTESQAAYDKAMSELKEKNSSVAYAKNDLAEFQSDFDTRNFDSEKDAMSAINKIAEGIVGPYGGFLSDGHMYDVLNPYAAIANVALTAKQQKYIDAWTGKEKTTTVWYLAYVYAAVDKD